MYEVPLRRLPRLQELQWASGHDESVEVNQRALIDKVLARYSGEFTVFRELLQNSDDAQATAVEIHFDTQKFLDRKNGTQPQSEPSKGALPDLKNTLVRHSPLELFCKVNLRSPLGTSMDIQEQWNYISRRRLDQTEEDRFAHWYRNSDFFANLGP
jgi:hypothetical protein